MLLQKELSPHSLKYLHSQFYTIVAFVIIIGAVLLRLLLLSMGWPVTNSDEAIMMLMAKHINEHRELPIFFYGQSYMGALEAYVGALFFRIFGPSQFSMHLTTVSYFTGFLTCLYFLARRLYGQKIALITLLFLVGSSAQVMSQQLQTNGGYPEIPFLGTLFFLLSYHLVDTYRQTTWRSRVIWYLLWGLVVGLSLWDDLLLLPYVAASSLLLIICCWRELLKWALWVALAGLIIGAWPLIYYNLHAPPGADSLTTLLNLTHQGDAPEHTLDHRLMGALFISVPMLLGFSSPCFVQDTLLQTHPPHGFRCLLIQKSLGIGYPLLLFTAVLLTTLTLVALWRHSRQVTGLPWDRREANRQLARLLLAIAPILTLLSYINSPASSAAPLTCVRFLTPAFISTPVLFWTLGKGLEPWRSFPSWFRRCSFLVRIAAIAVLCAISLQSIFYIFNDVPRARQEYQQYIQLAQRLGKLGITRFYSEYWTCNVLIFASQEKLICADTYGDLSHGLDRYYPYRIMVEQDKNPGFVYRSGDGRAETLEKLLRENQIPYERTVSGDFVIYKPSRPIPGLKLYQDG